MNKQWDYWLFDFYLFGVSFYVNKRFENSIDISETEPYQPNGATAYVFINFLWFTIQFENLSAYRTIYKNRYGIDIDMEYCSLYWRKN